MNEQPTIERIYILNGSIAVVEDASIYSPGVRVSEPMSLSCNAYLLKHRDDWLIWDTGTQDDLVNVSGGHDAGQSDNRRRGRLRRLWRRFRAPNLDAGPYARALLAPGSAAGDRTSAAERRRRSQPRQLSAPARAGLAEKGATVVSMEKVGRILDAESAASWINHETAQSETLPHAPGWIV